MISVQALIVEIKLVENHVAWSSHLKRQVDCNILETQMTNANDKKGEGEKGFSSSDAYSIQQLVGGLTMQCQLANDLADPAK